MTIFDHSLYMDLAIEQAHKAQQAGEVPVGAVLLAADGRILARAYNRSIGLHDPTAHAEMLAIRRAAAQLRNYRLLSTTLYVTIEPCVMCMGAVIHARIGTVVFGTHDPKWGAAGSLYHFAADHRLNHQPAVVGGVRADQCRALIQNFFQQRRQWSRQCPTS